MKIADLLKEAVVNSVFRDKPRKIVKSTAWDRLWSEQLARWNEIEQVLPTFLFDKVWFDPPVTFGSKDYKLHSTNFAHAHLIFGKVIVFYNVEADLLKLYSVSDHLGVEGKRMEANYRLVRSLDQQEWTEVPSPPRQVDPVDSQVTKSADLLFTTMTEDGQAFYSLKQFAASGNPMFVIQYISMVDGLTHVKIEDLHQLAQQFLSKK